MSKSILQVLIDWHIARSITNTPVAESFSRYHCSLSNVFHVPDTPALAVLSLVEFSHPCPYPEERLLALVSFPSADKLKAFTTSWPFTAHSLRFFSA